MTQLWDKTLAKLQKTLNEKQIYDSFFADTYINEIKGDTIQVVVNSAVASTLLGGKYKDLITETVNEISEYKYNIDFVQYSSIKKKQVFNNLNNNDTLQKTSAYFEDAIVSDKYTFNNFVVGEFNKEASQAAKIVASNPGKMFNPLFMYSESGLGKTHLCHAIGNYVKSISKPGAKILYITAQDFVEEYVRYVKGDKEAESLKDYFKNIDVLLLDDIQFLKGRTQTQEMFFVIYNNLISKGKQIVITSDKQPNELSGLENRLVTRFTQGLTVKIDNPDQETCIEILKKKIINGGIDINNVDNDVLVFFADQFSNNIRELEGAVNRLVLYSMNFNNNKITYEIALEVVGNMIGGKKAVSQLNEQKIISIVADYYNLSTADLTGKVRTGQIALARHIAMYLIRNNLDVSLKKIGESFGGKDHTTVINAIEKVDKELKTDEALKLAINELQSKIKNK